MKQPGKLYVCATPVGNLGDVTERLKTTLRTVDAVAAEDTRVTSSLLNHLGIRTPKLISCFDGNETKRSQEICNLLEDGLSVALVSDAGTPAVSDPGYIVVKAVTEAGFECISIPGPSALTAAISCSGIDSSHFHFEGFLPVKGSERKKRLEYIVQTGETVILYESPHRIHKTIGDLAAVYPPDTQVTIGRELTKIHEEFIRGTIESLNSSESVITERGEFVIIIGPSQQISTNTLPLLEKQVIRFLDAGITPKVISTLLVDFYSVPKRDIYQLCIEYNSEK